MYIFIPAQQQALNLSFNLGGRTVLLYEELFFSREGRRTSPRCVYHLES